MPLNKHLENFKRLEHEPNVEFYQSLQNEQQPHTLFIGCSDSRVHAEKLLQANPGEIFHIRNIANIVPREEVKDNHSSVVSAIEYAIVSLGVENVVVFGHSNCGGCAALMDLDHYKETFPYTAEWISQSEHVRDRVVEKFGDYPKESQLEILEKLNAIQQLDNLMTYSFVRNRVYANELHLYACYYNIATGEILEYKYNEADEDLADVIVNS